MQDLFVHRQYFKLPDFMGPPREGKVRENRGDQIEPIGI